MIAREQFGNLVCYLDGYMHIVHEIEHSDEGGEKIDQ
jgi:hypothetical protein